MKTAIYTFELYHNRKKGTTGSSMIRGSWLLNHWKEAKLFKIAEKYDAIIFQKVYFHPFLDNYKGIKILDMCDPDWLQEGIKVKETIDKCDAVTVSSEELRKFLSKITDKPVVFIPDRVDLNKFKEQKIHKDKAQNVIWFGYSQNQTAVDSALMSIKRLGLKLTVISDMPYHPSITIEGIDNDWIMENVKNIKYDQETAYKEIIHNGDIVINPKLEEGKFKYKSDNKTVISWALGMPVATNSEELQRFINEDERKKESEKRLLEVKEKYDVKLSVEQYKELINEISNNTKT
jgi:glycosyltransferase involved in cell wall biosynthesis